MAACRIEMTLSGVCVLVSFHSVGGLGKSTAGTGTRRVLFVQCGCQGGSQGAVRSLILAKLYPGPTRTFLKTT